jgi:Ca-activated chloride channel family protein
MVDFTFDNPIYLFALVSIPLLILAHFIIMKSVVRRALKFANFEAIQRVEGTQGVMGNVRSLSKNLFLLILRSSTLFFLILAAAGSTLWYVGDTNDFDFVLAIDASGSMLANDILPNRLEAAKESAIEFIDSLPFRTKIGVISFAGTSYIEEPLTTDTSRLRESIDQISVRSTHGTAIGNAIATAATLMYDAKRPKVVILLTDGQENVLSQSELSKVVRFANDEHMKINTIGIGTAEGDSLEILPEIDALFTLDQDTLIYVANRTGGESFTVSNEQELFDAYRTISTSSKADIPVELSFPFIILAIVLSFIEWVLINTKYRTIP